MSGPAYRYYEAQRTERIVIPFRLIAGLDTKYVGVTLGPQWYLGAEKLFGNIALIVEVGIL